MDVRAILVIGPPAGATETENITGMPTALLDVLGKPVVLRVADRLRKFGISQITVVGGAADVAVQSFTPPSTKGLLWLQGGNGCAWRTAESAFCDHAQAGGDVVLVLRLGAWAELDFDDLVQFHLDQQSRVTAAHTPDGAPLDVVAISGSRRNDAAFLFRHGLRQVRVSAAKYVFRGYANRLSNASDLRRLACDGLALRAQVTPVGKEIRPGIWVAPGARIQRGARILAPAYIGSHAKVRGAAVITRASVLEHHSVIDCGTVVEDSSILPYTYVGAGLDLTHAVVGFRRIQHLRRGAEIEIADARLIDMLSAHASLRALGHAVSLATFLPAQILRGFFTKSHREAPAQLPAAVQVPSPAITTPAELQPAQVPEAAQFPSTLTVARRYGDQ